MFIAHGPHRICFEMNQMNMKAALRNYWPHQSKHYSISVEFVNVDERKSVKKEDKNIEIIKCCYAFI